MLNLEELEDGHGKLCADVVEDLKTMVSMPRIRMIIGVNDV